MFSLIRQVTSAASVFLRSLKSIVSEVGSAVRHRRADTIVGLLKEGSPLETLVDSVASALFWALVLAPVLLVPAYYLLLSLK